MANAGHYDDKDEDGEVPVGDISSVVGSSEINQQISTAKRYPRSVAQFRREALELVTQDVEIASQCTYVLPRKKEDGSFIEGPSARFAEIILSCWRNTRSAARISDIGDEYITAEAIFYDVQNNTAIRYENMRRITNREGKRYSADMIGVTGNAACSIALRNAILKGIPKAFWADIHERAKTTAAGDAETFNKRRAAVLKAFEEIGVKPQQIYDFLEIKGPQDITTEHMMRLAGILTAIKDGDTSVGEVFGTAGEAKQRVGELVQTGRPRNEFERPNGGAKPAQTVENPKQEAKPQEAKPQPPQQATTAPAAPQEPKGQPEPSPAQQASAAAPVSQPEPAAAPRQQTQAERAYSAANGKPAPSLPSSSGREREPGEDDEEMPPADTKRSIDDELADYFKDRVADLAACKNAREVGDLKDSVLPNLDDARANQFEGLALERTRVLLSTRAKGPGRK